MQTFSRNLRLVDQTVMVDVRCPQRERQQVNTCEGGAVEGLSTLTPGSVVASGETKLPKALKVQCRRGDASRVFH